MVEHDQVVALGQVFDRVRFEAFERLALPLRSSPSARARCAARSSAT